MSGQQRIGVSLVVALAAMVVVGTQSASAADPAIISNGTVQLGINPTGELNVPGPNSAGGTPYVGLRFVPTNNEATAPGCLCEGWGAADATSGSTGYANQDSGIVNLALDSFTATPTVATSVVTVQSEGPTPTDELRVTHAYRPSVTPNLYEVEVTIKNLSGAIVDPRYRRVMDWDIEPTAFSEFSTIAGTAGAANVVFASDDGFASSNPLSGPSQIDFSGDAVASGPNDHGALFDFKFAPLAPNDSVTFRTFYGAAATAADARAALGAVGAEVYSLGQSTGDDGMVSDTPNTFIFGFAGVGGTAQVPAARFVSSAMSTPEAAGTASIAVELTAPSAAAVAVDYLTTDGSATAPSDYAVATGTLTFPPGTTTKSFTVPIVNDSADEPDETVNLTLSNPTGGLVLGSPSAATLTIVDDDESGTTTTTTTTSTTTTTVPVTTTSTTSTTTAPATSTTSTTSVPTTACASDRELRVSGNIWRLFAAKLDGARLGRRHGMGSVAIFLGPAFKPIAKVRGVTFSLDGDVIRTEHYVPYDLGGTRWWLSATMLDTRDLSDGAHMVSATVDVRGKSSCTVVAMFTVDNAKRRIASPSSPRGVPEWRASTGPAS